MYTRAEGIVKAGYIEDKLDDDAVSRLQQDIAEYGKFKKKAGARSFAKLIKDMRDAQNRYFSTRSDEALRQSKKLEEQVDRTVKLILGGRA